LLLVDSNDILRSCSNCEILEIEIQSMRDESRKDEGIRYIALDLQLVLK